MSSWRHADGHECRVEVTITNLLDTPHLGALVLNTRDVTDRVRLEEQLTGMAFSDSLTGLPNRALFKDRLQHALARRTPDGQTVAVLFLDLDGFKSVNDMLGHSVGDELLVTVAERLSSVVGSGDTVARFGGDEFAVLLENAAPRGGGRARAADQRGGATALRPPRASASTSRRASVSRASTTTQAPPSRCCETLTWRCTRPRRRVPAASPCSTPRCTRASWSASDWRPTCAAPSTRSSSSCTTSR